MYIFSDRWSTSRKQHDWSALDLIKLIVAQVTIECVRMFFSVFLHFVATSLVIWL